MELRIIGPQSQEQYFVTYVEAQTPAGYIVIKTGHAPMLATIISDSELSFVLISGEEKNIFIKRQGFIEIGRENVTVLLNQSIEK